MASESASEVATREALEQQPFIDNHWLLYNGPLHRDTVLEYFSFSKFYDRRSCNEELRMQGAKDIRLEHLEEMRGVQYLAEEVPGPRPDDPVFVIHKVLRTEKEQTQVLDVYYVLQNMVYQAPTIFSVLNARLRRCAHMLNKAHKTLNRAVAYGGGGGGGGAEEGGMEEGLEQQGGGEGGGAGSDMYRVARKGGKAAKRARAAAAAAAAHAEMHPPPPPYYGYPPHHHPHHHLYQHHPHHHPEGEPMVMVEGVGDHHHHYPLPPMMMPPPAPPLPHLLIEPCSPSAANSSSSPSAALLLQQQQQQQQEEEPRFSSRYPGSSPLASMLTGHHPESSTAVDRALGILRMEEVAGGPSGRKED